MYLLALYQCGQGVKVCNLEIATESISSKRQLRLVDPIFETRYHCTLHSFLGRMMVWLMLLLVVVVSQTLVFRFCVLRVGRVLVSAKRGCVLTAASVFFFRAGSAVPACFCCKSVQQGKAGIFGKPSRF
jgi:hypothetical protein